MVNQMLIRFRQHIFSGFYGKRKFVWFRHLVVSVSNLFLGNGYLSYLFFVVVKMTLINTVLI